ncbi:MAG: hypothetical protein H6739_36070 [Alphaproteobacteria bacterium]|nr:hypothetical protein [Alphaproteobacteria bacterium]
MWLALLSLAFAVPLAEPGETLGGSTVLTVEEHPEFQRVAVQLPDGRALQVEAVVGEGGACAEGDLALFPRWELLGEQREAEDQPPVVQALCARLAERGERLNLHPPMGTAGRAVGPEGTPSGGEGWTMPGPSTPGPGYGPLHGALLGLVLSALVALAGPGRRGWAALEPEARRSLVAVGLIGAVARLALSPRVVFWGPFFGFGRLTEAWGADLTHPLYGGGFATLMGPLSSVVGYSPGAVFGMHLLMASLAPPLVWVLARLLMPGERLGPLVAGLGMALLPVALRMSGTEVMHVDVSTFELLSVTAAVAFTRVGGLSLALTSALAIGFATHIRPEVLPAVAVPVVAVLAKAERRHVPGVAVAAVLIAGLAGVRALQILTNTHSAAVNYDRALSLWFVWEALLPAVRPPGATSYTNVFLNLWVTPPILPALAVAAFLGSRRRLALGLLGWWALAALPVLPKSWPLADAFRLQLPSQAPLVLLAGLGASALAQRRGEVFRKVLPIGIVALSIPYVPWVVRPWACHAEFRFLRETAGALPSNVIVYYDDAGPHHDAFGRWMRFATGRDWVGMSTFDAQDTAFRMVYLGSSCRVGRPQGTERDYGPWLTACPEIEARCTLTPWKTTTLPAETDVDVWLEGPVEVGYYEVEGCRGS